MAGDLTDIPVGNRDRDAVLGGYQWAVEVSRFFSYPSFFLLSSTPNLKPRCASRNRSDGTWMSSSSAAQLHILPNPPAILTVSIQGQIYEEHFVSALHFSWPQLSCAAECPIRGSRVVFASYRDSASQVQKFALRFTSSQDAQTFLDSVEEILKNSVDIIYPRDDDGCENLSQLEDTASNEILHYRAEDMIFTNMDIGYYPEMQSSSFQSPLLTNNVDSAFFSLNPVFASLPTSCSAENFQEAFNTPMDADFLSKLTTYLLDSSFHDILDKVEKVLDEMGGNVLH